MDRGSHRVVQGAHNGVSRSASVDDGERHYVRQKVEEIVIEYSGST